ncbi:AfsR/SARP family transcriptional regulator [Actinoplanes palleronii]|uniref:OmpR/PhoB-type domain-containing protein n=1 Tax=Actinoplanes palleronii TaxID=113570 RepID=A0ABQ4B5G7_9ACTN|nr:BTAD domain-containing putative transcriptional regulator [Actinoplanes palleronii]GIE65895.1 hypothetical protein Apa02nite_020030 [Actinoplanes palleronii]
MIEKTAGAALSLRILGPLSVSRRDEQIDAGPWQQRCMLAILLARPGEDVSVRELAELMWADSPPSAINIIHKYVGALRRALEPDLAPRIKGACLVRNGNAYRFVAGAAEVDVIRFRALVTQARAHEDRHEPGRALDVYEQAIGLGRGATADGLADSPSAQTLFTTLDGEFCEAVVAAAELAVLLRRPARLVAPLRRAAAIDPLNELVQATLMTTLAATGRRAEALRVHQSVTRMLDEDLGIGPGPDLRAAYLGLRGDHRVLRTNFSA